MEIVLKVDSAYPGDQGSGKARLDPETMLALKLSPGDIIRISGKKETYAKVWRSKIDDWNQHKIKIDNFTRSNAGVSPGDTVKIIRLDEVVPADVLILSPPEDIDNDGPDITSIHNHLVDFPVKIYDSVPISVGNPFMPSLAAYMVTGIEPENASIISQDTKLVLSDKAADGFESISEVTYEDIGGLHDELQRLRETIELPMRHPELFRKLGIEPPKGVLLHGPPGTGKTLIAKAVANESKAHFVAIAGPEIISKYYGESEQHLREVFEDAQTNSPAILFIDELDSITPKREEVTGEVERRVVAQLLTMMDGLEERGSVVVIGATNRIDAIDPALRRPGRFDREIEIGVPTEADRLDIIKIHTRGMPLADDVKPEDLASLTHGYTGADISALAREAAIRALRRYLPIINLEDETIPEEVLETIVVTSKDFRQALREITPSGMREVMLEVSHLRWKDVGGLINAIEEIREAVEYPLIRRESYDELGIRSPRGVLLYGPPGTGKTLIAKAVANESGANFIAVRGPQLLSKWVGESERAIREIFKKARQVAPAIIFFDELDALTPARGTGDTHTLESVLNQFLTEMDGLSELRDIVIMGATNRPDIVDPALLRSGRFDRLIYIGEPDKTERKQIISIHLRNMPLDGSNVEKLVDITEKWSEDNFEAFGERLTEKSWDIEDLISITKEIEPENGEIQRFKRRKILTDLFDRNNCTLSDPIRDKIAAKIAEQTEGYVGADIESLCREAGIFAMRENSGIVKLANFEQAIAKIHPTMNPRLRDSYKKIEGYFKGGLAREVQPTEYQ